MKDPVVVSPRKEIPERELIGRYELTYVVNGKTEVEAHQVIDREEYEELETLAKRLGGTLRRLPPRVTDYCVDLIRDQRMMEEWARITKRNPKLVGQSEPWF